MLSKPIAFEQDKTAIFIRNQEMHLHFSKLDSIKQRKNAYLPEINPSKSHFNLKKNFSTPSILRDKQFFILRENKLIYQKLDKINRRANQINSESEIIDGYLNIKKYTRNRFRELKQDLLDKENVKLKERISHTKSVIDNKILDNDFQRLKKIARYLRKVKPEDSVRNIYLNRKESQIIRKYEKEKIDFYLKSKEKENKENNEQEYSNKRKNFSTIDDNKLNTRTFNKKYKLPFNIDKKILKKIAYI